MDVIALAIGLQQLSTELPADPEPRRADRLEDPLRDDLPSVLRREHEVRVQAVYDVRSDAEVLRRGHQSNVKRVAPQ
jgi:hypothetical protein